MMQGWPVVGIAIAYLGVLFIIAYLGDQRRRRRPGWQLWVYGLSIAVYCTSWSFYGTVGQAAAEPWSFVPIYLGPILLFALGWRLLARITVIAKREHITSIADFIAARYGKSQTLAMVLTLIAVVGVVPYIALQLRAIVMGLDLLLGDVSGGSGHTTSAEVALVVSVLLAMFTMLFGTRQIDVTEHHRGMMLAIAFESLVKLIVFMVIGLFALKGLLFEGNQQQWVALAERSARHFTFSGPQALPGRQMVDLLIYSLLCLGAILCLPRQFHVTVVENDRVQDIRQVRWIFCGYLLLMGAMVLPLALAGEVLLPPGTPPDSYVISLPLAYGNELAALLAFLGGISAATAMVIVSTTALSSMISNDLVLPLLLRRSKLDDQRFSRFSELLLNVRRSAILLLLLGAWGFYLGSEQLGTLSQIGYLSFLAIAQFVPPLILGLFWRRANRLGVYLGLGLGLSVWLLSLLQQTLFGPWLAVTIGGWLSPPQGLAETWLSADSWLILLSLGLNLFGLLAGSLVSATSVSEQLQAARFVDVEGINRSHGPSLYQSRISVAELEILAARFVGAGRVRRSFARFARQQDRELEPQQQAGPALIEHTELLLAGVFGASSARLVLASALHGKKMQLAELATIVDEASEVLQFNRGLLQGAIEHINQGISVIDHNLQLVAWNRRYLELFEFPPGLVRVGRPIEDIIRYNAARGLCGPGAQEQQVRRRVEHMRRGTPHVSARQRPDGRMIEMQGNPMPGGGFVMSFTDITPFRKAQQALLEANENLEARVAERTRALSEANRQLLQAKQQAEQLSRSKSRFLAAVSHDLMQPLNAAKLFTASLLESRPEGETHRLASHIDSSLTAAEELLGDLLDISRLEAGKLEIHKRTFALAEVFDTLAAEFGALASRQGIDFRVVGSGVQVDSDAKFLRRILQNFLTNAFRYNPGGKVLLGLRHHQDSVSLEVWDNGPGIPADKLKRIFDEFTRLECTRGGSEQGLGLGLAIARGIASVLGHAIAVRSRPGRCTVFSVSMARVRTLPVSGPLQPLVVPCRPLAGIRVLCIDNERDILSGMQALLGGWGCEVACATDLDSAATALRQNGIPQLILSDYHLDLGATGLELLARLRREFGHGFSGVVISADRTPEVLARVRAQGFHFLVKPVKPMKLRALMNSLEAGSLPQAGGAAPADVG